MYALRGLPAVEEGQPVLPVWDARVGEVRRLKQIEHTPLPRLRPVRVVVLESPGLGGERLRLCA